MKRIIFLLAIIPLLLTIGLTTELEAKAENFWPVHDKLVIPSEKQKSFGIAVAFVDLQQANIFVTFRRINGKSLKDSIEDSKALDFLGGQTDAFRLDLSGRAKMIFVNLPEGLYQITQVDVPHFDLPYKISTDNSDTWRFRIHRNKINYIGTMKVSAIRSKNAVDTVWLNQFATHLSDLQKMVTESESYLPLIHGVGYKDPFFDTLKPAANE